MKNIPMAVPYIGEEEANAVYRQVKSGWISMGEKVKELEKLISNYIGSKHTVVFNNGTGTLHAALLALGVKKNDEILVPSLSYISSANAVLYCGAKPVFVEESPNTFNVDSVAYLKKITRKTKAIMTVDLKGMPVDYDSIKEIADKNNLAIVSDSAESFGAKYKEKLVGMQVDVHSFSMFANKNVTAGEGGFITTNNDRIAEICRCIRNQGQSERYNHIMIGHNYRMTDILAAFAIEQIKRIEWIMEQKNRLAKKYNEGFKNYPLLTIPYIPDYVTRHSWYLYCLKVDPRVDRDKMAEIMRKNGVDSRLSFPPIPLQPIYKELFGYKQGDFPNSERIFQKFIDIPIWVNMKQEHIRKVINVTKESAEQALTK